MLKKETNPEFARRTLLDEYSRQGSNVAATARAMHPHAAVQWLRGAGTPHAAPPVYLKSGMA